MARPRHPSRSKEVRVKLPLPQKTKFVEGRINGGLITSIDPADIPTGALRGGKNYVVRMDATARRGGSIITAPTAPNAENILKFATLRKDNGDTYSFRFTKSSVHKLAGGVWTAIVGVLNGTDKDRIKTAVVNNELVFSNNGADEIQLINVVGNTHADLGNAPKYRYITGFAGRVVGAALAGSNEVQIGWSGDRNLPEWNPAVDESAGSSPLVDNPSDKSDHIKGIDADANLMVILRENSLWVAQKQPITQNPFYAVAAVPGIGMDTPYSLQRIGGSDGSKIAGLAWLDTRTRTVYAWSPGSVPEPIGRPIENVIISGIDDKDTVFSDFDPTTNRYSVCIPVVGSTYVRVYTYDFTAKAWAPQEYYDLTSIDNAAIASAIVTIDDLVGTIDDLVGTIDSLSPVQTITTTRVFGRGDGTIAQADDNAETDGAHTDFPTGIPYTTEIISKSYLLPSEDINVAELALEIKANRGTTITVEYSKDGGDTEASWVAWKTFVVSTLNKAVVLRAHKNIRTRRFAWRAKASTGSFDLLNYELHVYRTAESKNAN